MSDTFHDQIVDILPKLRVQALALTRNRAMAEDLVQDAVCNALSAQTSFIPGTNFGAWMHRILRNRFISDLRKKRETTDIDDTPQSLLAVGARHDDRLALQELDAALARLPDDQREALVLGVLEGMSYQELAEISGCAVGTAKSRVFRARRQLETWLTDDTPSTSRRESVKNISRKTLPREKNCPSPVRNGLKHGTLEQSRSRAVVAGV